MALTKLTAKLIARLNKGSNPAGRDATLGQRMSEMEDYGVLAYSYASAHADKTYAEADLPPTPVVYLTLTSADAAANLILPATKKVYIVYNNSGYTVTCKITGQSGTGVPTGFRRYLIYNGTDIVPLITYLASPTIITPALTDKVVTHDYGAAAADWTLTADERRGRVLKVSNASGAVNAIVNVDTPQLYMIDNQSGQSLTVKNATGSTITVASTKRAWLYNDGTNIVRVSADA